MNLNSYLNETKSELKHVNWPSRSQTVNFTVIVIGLSAVIAALLGAFDLIFNLLLKLIF